MYTNYTNFQGQGEHEQTIVTIRLATVLIMLYLQMFMLNLNTFYIVMLSCQKQRYVAISPIIHNENNSHITSNVI